MPDVDDLDDHLEALENLDDLDDLDHPQLAAALAVQLIVDGLDGGQLARLRLLIAEAGTHFHGALDAMVRRPATTTSPS